MAAPLRVIIEQEASDGPRNMAVDEVLLETALTSEQATLRWYRWAEPTLSLGHFQPHDDPAIDDRFAALSKVRRLSGGGAILHDQEWTYSIAIGPEHPLAPSPRQLYVMVHASVIDVLQQFSIPAERRGKAETALDHHFLCFSRGDANDVVVGPHKVLGSAQRRRRGAVLQHGALLMHASSSAPEFPGLVDLARTSPDEAKLFADLNRAVAVKLDVDWQIGSLDSVETERAKHLVLHKYLDLSRFAASGEIV